MQGETARGGLGLDAEVVGRRPVPSEPYIRVRQLVALAAGGFVAHLDAEEAVAGGDGGLSVWEARERPIYVVHDPLVRLYRRGRQLGLGSSYRQRVY